LHIYLFRNTHQVACPFYDLDVKNIISNE